MGLLAAAFNPRPKATWAPDDDRWYAKDLSGWVQERGEGGIPLSAESILRCGTVLAAVRFRGDSWAMCPPSTYRKTPTGRVEEPEHYSQQVLRHPNLWQTGNRWRHVQGVWLATWGNAYSEIRSGASSFAEELWPIHPSIIDVVDQRNDGSLIYLQRRPNATERRLDQAQVLHFRDISTDGFRGLPMYRLIRNVVSIALLAERHASTFLQKGSRIAGLLVPSNPLDPIKRKELRDSVNEDFGGWQNTGTLGVLPYGIDLKQIASTNRESQFAELSDAMIGAILRFLGVPGVVVGYADKTATYASAKEFFESGGIKHCVLPILTNVEAEEEKALLLRGDGRQIKHNLDVLLRANTKDRFAALYQAIGGPWMTVNEGRRIEDLNEDADPRHDEILTPSNMSPELNAPDAPDGSMPPEDGPPTPPQKPRPVLPAEDDAPDASGALLRQYAHDNAVRVVRREIATIVAKAPRFARNGDGWRAFVLETYENHVNHVAQVMRVPESSARGYCDRQAAALLARGAGAVEAWEKEIPPQLAALALGE